MTLGTGPIRSGCAWATMTLLVMQLVTSCATSSPPRIALVSELQIGTDYQGPVQSVALDAAGKAWMATTKALYSIVAGKAEAVDTAVGEERQLALAPGGGVYAWLPRGRAPSGLFTVELFEIPKKPIAELRLEEFPHGFASLYFGGDGRLIVTVSPLQDAEGLRGEFLYVFWARDGRELARVTLDKRLAGIVDVTGEALLLLGESNAIAFRNDGRQLWRVDGRFRNAALAAKGTIALLNPADQHAINDVRVYRNGQVTPLTLPAPVYELALTADGSLGAVGIGTGEVLLVMPPSCNATTCKPTQKVAGLSDTAPYRVTALRFVDAKTLAIGRLQRVAAGTEVAYPEGEIVAALIGSDRPLFRRVIPLEQPATWAPIIDASFGVPFFAAYTRHRAYLVSLEK